MPSPTAAARPSPAPAPSAPDRAADGRADGTSRSTSRRARRALSTNACPSSRCTSRRAAADTSPTCWAAGCAGAGPLVADHHHAHFVGSGTLNVTVCPVIIRCVGSASSTMTLCSPGGIPTMRRNACSLPSLLHTTSSRSERKCLPRHLGSDDKKPVHGSHKGSAGAVYPPPCPYSRAPLGSGSGSQRT